MSNDTDTERGADSSRRSSSDGDEGKVRKRRRRSGRRRSGPRSGKGTETGGDTGGEGRRSGSAGRKDDSGRPKSDTGGDSKSDNTGGDSTGGASRRRRRRRGEQAGAGAAASDKRGDADAAPGRSRTRRSGQDRQAAAGDGGEPGRRTRRRRRRRNREDEETDSAADSARLETNELGPAGERGLEEPGAGGTDSAGEDSELRDPELLKLLYPEEVMGEEPDEDDPDPVSFVLEQIEGDERAPLATEFCSVVGVKFASAGRISLYDSGDVHYRRGEEVIVESERGGVRVGTVGVATQRRPGSRISLKRVLRRPNRSDRRALERNEERSQRALQLAREAARSLALPIKVFRAEYAHTGKKLRIYFTSEERIDFRELVRRLTTELHGRVEMRQTGVRDEAKMVGGIGSCGQELCCTTWLPDFMPVSIKMAKDQGLVLNPTKVSGQCGRLKCCLVYEQDTYAELRKGLPKLGKRVVTEAGEGRVVEVDVLRQRVRVSLGGGESQVFAGDQVKPLFPTQTARKKQDAEGSQPG